MRKDHATIHDVARHAEVSVKTVSRVLNHERGVSDAMKARVQASMKALDYRPNAAARVLRRKLTRSIGFVCEDISEPVQARLARAIESVASRHRCTLTVSLTHHDPGREQAVLESLMARQIDGILLWPTGTASRYLQRLVATVPIVCVDRPIPGVETDVVLCDNIRGAAEATGLLVGRGHRRIAFVGDPPELFTQTERLKGYQRALAEAGLPEDPRLEFCREIETDHSPLRQQLRYWKASPEPPTALFAASSIASTALARLLDRDDPVDMVGFDSFPLDDVIRGGVTVIDQDVDAMGRAAAETLFRRIDGENVGLTRIRIAPRVVERGR
ncbi:LacI family DNA-binding transcriptional regulator [Acidipropionibacterium virtanenii]|uniref:Ribose operon repressor n=1 Tax=Acidipropionibacterium virtanenii TaxID=2057246 RepID=A0A344UQJ8_9ACTN|nr:LacI family DNA-binding transcriptional regulator [Acidipropionibacterium virtanenii]AXE37546.1 Ribose operon repressor [Acidipropionibacterium virtanenii]